MLTTDEARQLEEFRPIVLRIARRLHQVDMPLEDLVQEGMIAVWRAAGTYVPLGAWSDRTSYLAYKAKFGMLDAIRQYCQSRRKFPEHHVNGSDFLDKIDFIPSRAEDPVHRSVAHWRRHLAAAQEDFTIAIDDRLSAPNVLRGVRDVPDFALLLRYSNGETQEALGIELGVTPSAVSLRLTRCRQRVRDRLVRMLRAA